LHRKSKFSVLQQISPNSS